MNGMGKTNLLDAIYYLCIGKSYFNARDIMNVRYEQDFFRLEGTFSDHEQDDKKMVVKWATGKRKALEIDDIKIKKYSDHIGQFPVIIIAPKDILLLVKGSSERRKFIDSTISQYDTTYLDSIVQYTRLIKQRNAALKTFKESGNYDSTYIDALDSQILPLTEYIYKIRKSYSKNLSKEFEYHYQQISGGQEQCTCKYESQFHNEKYIDLCKKYIDKDRVTCRSSSGTHKDDLSLWIEGNRIQDHGSQGQIKSVVLALKLAQFSILKKLKKTIPILLLDDLFDKLDNNRVTLLLNLLLSDNYGQIFISDTSLDRIPKILGEQNTKFSTFVIGG